MKIYLPNGTAIDDGRVPRSTQEHEGWYTGKLVEDRDQSVFPTWAYVIGAVLLCAAIVLLCTWYAPEKPECGLECRGMTTTLTTPEEK